MWRLWQDHVLCLLCARLRVRLVATPVLEEPGGYTKVGLQEKLDPKRTTAWRQKMVREIWKLRDLSSVLIKHFCMQCFASHSLTANFKKKKKLLTLRPLKNEDVDEFVTSSEQIWRNLALQSLAHQWILWCEWVPSKWESNQLIKTSQ